MVHPHIIYLASTQHNQLIHMNTQIHKHPLLLFTCISLFALNAVADNSQAIDALEEYMEFAPYSAGALSPDQLQEEDYGEFLIIDTRNEGQYSAGHIPQAINIEWRDILSHRDELPKDRPILLYCETGLLSSKAHFALNIAGFENVKVLWGGYIIWSARQSFQDAKGLKGIKSKKMAENR